MWIIKREIRVYEKHSEVWIIHLLCIRLDPDRADTVNAQDRRYANRSTKRRSRKRVSEYRREYGAAKTRTGLSRIQTTEGRSREYVRNVQRDRNGGSSSVTADGSTAVA